MLSVVDSLLARYRALREVRARFPAALVHYSTELVGDVTLGDGVQIGRRSRLANEPGGELTIDDHTWIGDDCTLGSGGRLHIGRRVSLQCRAQLFGDVELGAGTICASDLYASSGAHAFALRPELPLRVQDRMRWRQPWSQRSRPVVIGEDCWIGVHVVITPGVTIGRGCVVGANSVVTRDLPPYSVAVGSPARVIRARFDFAPPAAIDATCDEHVPYFYSGFRQLGDREDQDDALARVYGGYVAESAFTLALAPGNALRVEVHALADGVLSHGTASVNVRAGDASLRFSQAIDARGMSTLTFSGPRLSLVVRAARVEE